ncbi:MAG: phenylalanine--tRNA ligase subunit alpha [Rhodospirillales bacterium]|nr:phenylalanine--tRNA ligase subunit alpha [Rhodospirillales bacterium]
MNAIDLKDELTARIEAANDLKTLEEVRVTALGKKGKITDLMKMLGQLDGEERKVRGQELNALKDEIADFIKVREDNLKRAEMDRRLADETLDVTLSPRPEKVGHTHPISQTMEELQRIFTDMGFTVAEGPDIEDDWHNFTALNFPEGHPAREMQDTFFLPPDPDESDPRKAVKVLRTQTSTAQIREMTKHGAPIKLICMGRVYRSDYDATHTPMFHQMEVLYIDKHVTMGHLKGCLLDFLTAFFEVDDVPIRLRPSFFPFTEPSAEVDIGCIRKNGELKIGKAENPEDQSWLEVLGSGMVHPNVLRNCGIDPDEYQGFALGAGLDRLTMLKYGIPDLRSMFESDNRWLNHYGFSLIESLK